MKKTFLYALLLAAGSLCTACGGSGDDPDPTPDPATDPTETLVAKLPAKTNSMKVFAHYMPWFVAPKSSGVWNHWTMSANALASDNANLASNYHPLSGAYASDDATILDYQCLLMKYSGLDGVIINYMGESGKNDFATIAAGTKAMVSAATKAGLQFAICYDEQTALSSGVFPSTDDARNQGRTDMRYIKNNYFSKSNYAKNGSRPLLLIFGPVYVKGSSDWDFITNPLGEADVVVLSGHAANYGSPAGEFMWVNPAADYSQAKNFSLYVGGAMPGFWDVYKRFGQGDGYTTYDRENGALYQRQLTAAKSAGVNWLQVSTWNDYGEGTIIEPTTEFKYQYLEATQRFTGVSYGSTQLDIIYRWLKAAQAHPTDKRIEQAYKYLNALLPDQADELIKAME